MTIEDLETFFNQEHNGTEICMKKIMRQHYKTDRKTKKKMRWVLGGEIYYCQAPKNHPGPCVIFIG